MNKLYSILLLSLATGYKGNDEFCTIEKKDDCSETMSQISFKYVLYDVNPSEGFNLRRDVYMRFAVFLKKLNTSSKNYWYLVLPPWEHLYHWRSKDVGDQNGIPWSHFFDIDSLRRFVPVIEMEEFMTDTGFKIDNIYYLQHFKDAFTKNWEWSDKWAFDECKDNPKWKYINDTGFVGTMWGYDDVRGDEVKCISFQGGASLLKEVLDINQAQSTLFHHGEIVLHDSFGDKLYWECRRSMRFSTPLIEEATKFRKIFLNSQDLSDNTVKPKTWEQDNHERNAYGGPYLCVHLRRQDFLYGRSAHVPSLEYAAQQIEEKLIYFNLSVVFISTDAPENEIIELKNLLKLYKVVQYKPDEAAKHEFKDGGVAIIDQIICSHAKYFIGTHESTFSFRIQEEREIMGFPMEMTFNRLCGEDKTCNEPSKWKIVF